MQLTKFAREVDNLARSCGPLVAARYLARTAISARAVLRERNLSAVDRTFTDTYFVRARGVTFKIPCGALREAHDVEQDSAEFGAVREIYARDVYFRRFTDGLRVRNFVDLGANRGHVSNLVARTLGAGLILGVEANEGYAGAFEVLANANGLEPGQRHRTWKFASDFSDQRHIRVGDLLDEHKIDRLDLLKCDIEGGETDVFLSDGSFLERVDRVVMELHPDFGVPSAKIAQRIKSAGFHFVMTTDDGQDTRVETATYLYASRYPDELVPCAR